MSKEDPVLRLWERYIKLPFYKKFFFPEKLRTLLHAYAKEPGNGQAGLNIVRLCIKKSWAGRRKILSELQQFFEAPFFIAFKELHTNELLTEAKKKAACEATLQHQDPWQLAKAVLALNERRMLEDSYGDAIFQAVVAHDSPWGFSQILIRLHHYQTINPDNISEFIYFLKQHPDPDAVAHLLYLTFQKGYLTKNSTKEDIQNIMIHATELSGQTRYEQDENGNTRLNTHTLLLRRLWLFALTYLTHADMKIIFQQSSQPILERAMDILLNKPVIFAHAAPYINQRNKPFDEYRREYIYPFIKRKLQQLQAQDGIIEMTENEARIGCFILRELLRAGPTENLISGPDFHRALNRLLAIPAIQQRAHCSLTGIENELLRLALKKGNRSAVERLYAIPAVKAIALEHNFYNSRLLGFVDLRALAANDESAMLPFSLLEQSRYDLIHEHYEPMLASWGGTDAVFEQLQVFLAARYMANKAQILDKKKTIILPLTWDEFVELKLTKRQTKAALRAYYQHRDHTALRFLSIPNYWMSENAEFVCKNRVTGEKWADFISLKKTIALFWLAAMDPDMPPTDDHTLEGRIDYFVHQLANLNRVHNWDESRINLRLKRKEEFDDLEGDKPGCHQGMKQQLFNAVIGHSLFESLTWEKISAELNSFIYNYFKQVIQHYNRDAISHALFYTFIMNQSCDVFNLSLMNIPVAEQNLFIQGLKERFGNQLDCFITKINEYFALTPSLSHIEKYYSSANLQLLIKPREMTRENVLSNNRDSFYSALPNQAVLEGESSTSCLLKN